MTSANCSKCGHPLTVDLLNGEPRPCENCGSLEPVGEGRPVPEVEHQRRIDRKKFFEIASVVVIIAVGVGYFAISAGGKRRAESRPATLTALSTVLVENGFASSSESTLLGRGFSTYRRRAGALLTTVDLVTHGESGLVETVIVVAGVPAGEAFPPDSVAEPAVQEAFDEMVRLGESLIPGSTQALSKAAATMTLAGDPGLTYNKGVAQTPSGWKVTYIAYREYVENAGAIPLLTTVYQRLDSASAPESEAFNRALYTAIHNAKDVKLAMQDQVAEVSSP